MLKRDKYQTLLIEKIRNFLEKYNEREEHLQKWFLPLNVYQKVFQHLNLEYNASVFLLL